MTEIRCWIVDPVDPLQVREHHDYDRATTFVAAFADPEDARAAASAFNRTQAFDHVGVELQERAG